MLRHLDMLLKESVNMVFAACMKKNSLMEDKRNHKAQGSTLVGTTKVHSIRVYSCVKNGSRMLLQLVSSLAAVVSEGVSELSE